MTDQTCGIAITLRQVVTGVQPNGVGRYTKIPFPADTVIYLDAVAQMFGVSRRRIYNLVSVHRAQLDPPMYRRMYPTRYLKRIISSHDLDVLRALFPIYVKH